MIPIQNIYYMLSYAFQVLNEQGYKNIATEQFNNTGELMAAILEKGIAIQLKRGLGKEYILQTEALSSLRGKIDIAESIKTQSMLRKQLICTYDEFSVNSIMNRIIKSTVELLLRSNISKQRKKNLRKLMVYFSEVDFIFPLPARQISTMKVRPVICLPISATNLRTSRASPLSRNAILWELWRLFCQAATYTDTPVI